MASVNGAEVAVKLASSPPPQLRIVGFTATTTTGSASDSPNELCGASPRAVPESPLSRLLRSATWPTLRVRLCKSEIPAPGSSSVQDVNVANAAGEGSSDSSDGRSSSPISIPRVYSCSLIPTWSSIDAASLPRRSRTDGSVAQRSLPSQHLTYSPMSCSNTDQGAGDMDFAAACWTLE